MSKEQFRQEIEQQLEDAVALRHELMQQLYERDMEYEANMYLEHGGNY